MSKKVRVSRNIESLQVLYLEVPDDWSLSEVDDYVRGLPTAGAEIVTDDVCDYEELDADDETGIDYTCTEEDL